MVTKVFISHASADTWVARQIASHLHGRGACTFLDEADIQTGDDFRERIIQAETDCSELVVLLTPWSIKRSYVLFEISCFLHSRKRVVGILHGLSAIEAMADPVAGDLLVRRDLVDINGIETYFDEIGARVAADTGTQANG